MMLLSSLGQPPYAYGYGIPTHPFRIPLVVIVAHLLLLPVAIKILWLLQEDCLPLVIVIVTARLLVLVLVLLPPVLVIAVAHLILILLAVFMFNSPPS